MQTSIPEHAHICPLKEPCAHCAHHSLKNSYHENVDATARRHNDLQLGALACASKAPDASEASDAFARQMTGSATVHVLPSHSSAIRAALPISYIVQTPSVTDTHFTGAPTACSSASHSSCSREVVHMKRAIACLA